MKNCSVRYWLSGAIFCVSVSANLIAAEADPTGILKKPIPDKLVVLTFDDGPESHFSVVTPILKQHGFGGSFYVCDFDSFRFRKDWYLSWSQMRQMVAAGLEIGNHTSGHAGGASINHFLNMDDSLIANSIPKSKTIAWPVYASNPGTYPALLDNGYLFGRGGYKRPYRPTVDNPFDVPSLEPKTAEEFPKAVRQATNGKIVVLIYHGVPDIEHKAVSMDPGVFKVQMQYLKDNGYKVIAFRDLAEYIDVSKAAKLPPTPKANEYKADPNEPLASEEKPIGKPEIAAPVPVKPADSPVVSKVPVPEAPELVIPADGTGITLGDKRSIVVPKSKSMDLKNVLSGSGTLIKTGEGTVRILETNNTYSGGTVLAGGVLFIHKANSGLGTGPITIYPETRLAASAIEILNPIVAHGGTIHADGGFGSRVESDIKVLGELSLTAYGSLGMNSKSGGISGTGGVAMLGNPGPFGGYLNMGKTTLFGVNTYTGPTSAKMGTLVIPKAKSLYGGDVAQFNAEKIRIYRGATLLLKVGGPEEFTGEMVSAMLKRLTELPGEKGLMGGGIFAIDTTSAKAPVVISSDIADAPGSQTVGFTIQKTGDGTMVLTGKSKFSGRVHIERGMLSVSSFNSVKTKMPQSSLGVPADAEAGEILMGDGDATVPKGDGPCGLIYTGAGETTDRIINLAGKNSVVTFEQAGSGHLKFTSPIVISGFGGNKQITLSGEMAGSGEFTGDLFDPHDRAGKAKTSVTKSGPGVWTLSGVNTYTGPTIVKQGILRITQAKGLRKETEVEISQGAKLNLDFAGEVQVTKLTIDGKAMAPGSYSAANAGGSISGKGVLVVK